MYHSKLAALLYAIIPFGLALDPTRLVYQFPGNDTWIENLFVRPSGSLLISLKTTPDVYLIDPLAQNPKPLLIHDFTANTWLSGITSTDASTYYVIGANATWEDPSPTPGSTFIYRIHFPSSSSSPSISIAAHVKDAVFLNGFLMLNPTTLLSSDSTLGVVWAIDITTGASRIVIKDPLFAPTPSNPKIGINGIRLLNSHTLYFANSAQLLLGKVPIHSNGTAVGGAVKIASATPGTYFDDFALDRFGNAFVATASGDSVVKVMRNGSVQVIAGMENTTEIAQPTSAQFGRTEEDSHVLYVTTTGGLKYPIDGHIVVGGQIVAVDTRGAAG